MNKPVVLRFNPFIKTVPEVCYICCLFMVLEDLFYRSSRKIPSYQTELSLQHKDTNTKLHCFYMSREKRGTELKFINFYSEGRKLQQPECTAPINTPADETDVCVQKSHRYSEYRYMKLHWGRVMKYLSFISSDFCQNTFTALSHETEIEQYET